MIGISVANYFRPMRFVFSFEFINGGNQETKKLFNISVVRSNGIFSTRFSDSRIAMDSNGIAMGLQTTRNEVLENVDLSQLQVSSIVVVFTLIFASINIVLFVSGRNEQIKSGSFARNRWWYISFHHDTT